ncbi:hypothetical protein QWY84_07860 [Aquisalimonas lutea]|uniref:tetratricopeptide repeat protein n=1 Tax=Aquisalimonas lutea TaxID=1327750 RepID=UPI0025B54FA5|nr:hypothetical protein [Aquisalimonas lutea]MDN3517519.1 hypothetical protein [Aquisalimonas lutea]
MISLPRTIPGIAVVVMLAILVACTEGSESPTTADELHERAQSALGRSGTAQDHQRALELLDEALRIDSNHVPSLRSQVRLLVRAGRDREALGRARRLAEVSGQASDQLYRCMLIERVERENPVPLSCYHDVVERYETPETPQIERDLNYLVALKLADSPRLSDQLEQHKARSAASKEDPNWLTDWIANSSRKEIVDQFTRIGSPAEQQ